MKTRSIVMTIALCLLALSFGFAEDANMGTWKLNEAKSKIPAGVVKNNIVTYSAEGDSVKVTTDGIGPDGQPMHTEWTGKFDGKDYPLTGDRSSESRVYNRINAHTLKLENKKDGKIINQGTIVISADGKSRTLNLSGKDRAGKAMKSLAVYDKQ